MRVVLCALAKNENIYINEWCHYYLNMGFSHLYIYDNNDFSSPYVGDFIDKDILDKITIFDLREQKGEKLQADVYSRFYNEYNNSFDWCAFFDVDEFLDLNKEFKTIQEFLGQEKFEKFNQIRIKWRVFDDNDIIERNENTSVVKTFKRLATKGLNNNEAKSIIRGVKTKITMPNENYASNLNSCLPSGKALQKIVYGYSISEETYKFETIFLNHYKTKSLSEFLKYKFFAGNKISKGTNPSSMKYYWEINNITKEKIKYLKEKYPEIDLETSHNINWNLKRFKGNKENE